jgi:N-acetylneuraminic acid mutarotase
MKRFPSRCASATKCLDTFDALRVKEVAYRSAHKVKAHNNAAIKGHLIRGAFYLLLLSAGTSLAVFRHELAAKVSHRTLTFAERVAYQQAIEEIYWRHRICPKENSNPKPSLDAVMSKAQLEKKVKDYLQNSQALADYWKRPITAQQLQAEMDRMAQNTRQPEVLQELFEALGNDAFVIAECLARPMLAERLLAHPEFKRVKQQSRTFDQTVTAGANYTLPTISGGACIEDTWMPTTLTGAPDPRESHTAVWTGIEMIVWGGDDRPSGSKFITFNTGARYNLVTDTWTATSTINAPSPRFIHTALWTGSEMIVWGGSDENFNPLNTGARYNPGLDTWTPTSTTNVPVPRISHAAVWTGSEMIVWGGSDYHSQEFNTGGRYNPSTDSWTATSTTNAPTARSAPAVWTGSEMIVWGGYDGSYTNTGGRYTPGTDSWTATSTMNAPEGRADFTGVWTGDEMIVWGGSTSSTLLNSGGRYNPNTDAWVATTTVNAPSPRYGQTAVWTDDEMIVWGGIAFGIPPTYFNTGGRYSPITDSWIATSPTNAPTGRFRHTAVWSGSKMIVWGGFGQTGTLNTGGRYCVRSPVPCNGRCSPTPRPRPTPHQRPTPPPGIDGSPAVAYLYPALGIVDHLLCSLTHLKLCAHFL